MISCANRFDQNPIWFIFVWSNIYIFLICRVAIIVHMNACVRARVVTLIVFDDDDDDDDVGIFIFLFLYGLC